MKWNQIALAEENFSDEYSDGGAIRRDFVLKPNSLSPYQAYKTLKEEFGTPNSGMFDEMKSQWQYALQSPEAYFEVYDWKYFTWSIGVYLKQDVSSSAEDVANKFLKTIEGQASKYSSAIKEKLKKPDGIVIENPFITYRETADSLYEMLEDMKQPKENEDEEIKFGDWMKHYDVCRAAFIMYLSSVEGFVNLIYELYLRKDLREKRIYDRVCREQIDLKLRLAPVYCECFKADVLDSSAEEFKEFHSLANLRNDFVHANLTKPMMNAVVYEDDFEFVIDSESTTSIGIPNNFREFESHHVLRAKEITQDLIDYVISAMEPRYRREFEYILNDEHIKVEYEDGQLYIS
ncbi:MAG: hypothetical protein ACTH69_14480 [Halomonas sp.]|uniref:hypothetical protein n=1 Tax=Halomonas sp. TaxID=1486246 RepID=UPI003F939D42